MNSLILKENSATVVYDGRPYNVRRDHPNFKLLVVAARHQDWDTVKANLTITSSIENFMKDSNVTIKDGSVYYKGEQQHGLLVDRIVQQMQDGFEPVDLINFLDKLAQNPSYHSRNQLYDFLEHHDIALDAEGFIIGYKAITDDWKDKWTRTLDYRVGQTPKMERRLISDDPTVHCAPGLHVGSIEYVRGYASGYGNDNGDRIVLVRVNPKDVVAVPKDSSCQKMRTCEFTVLREFNGVLPSSIRSSNDPYNDFVQPESNVDYDEDYDELEDWPEDYLD